MSRKKREPLLKSMRKGPKPVMFSMKVPPDELKAWKKRAEELTAGNVSALLRYVATLEPREEDLVKEA